MYQPSNIMAKKCTLVIVLWDRQTDTRPMLKAFCYGHGQCNDLKRWTVRNRVSAFRLKTTCQHAEVARQHCCGWHTNNHIVCDIHKREKTGWPLSSNWEIPRHFPDSSQHSYPSWTTTWSIYFDHAASTPKTSLQNVRDNLISEKSLSKAI